MRTTRAKFDVKFDQDTGRVLTVNTSSGMDFVFLADVLRPTARAVKKELNRRLKDSKVGKD